MIALESDQPFQFKNREFKPSNEQDRILNADEAHRFLKWTDCRHFIGDQVHPVAVVVYHDATQVIARYLDEYISDISAGIDRHMTKYVLIDQDSHVGASIERSDLSSCLVGSKIEVYETENKYYDYRSYNARILQDHAVFPKKRAVSFAVIWTPPTRKTILACLPANSTDSLKTCVRLVGTDFERGRVVSTSMLPKHLVGEMYRDTLLSAEVYEVPAGLHPKKYHEGSPRVYWVPESDIQEGVQDDDNLCLNHRKQISSIDRISKHDAIRIKSLCRDHMNDDDCLRTFLRDACVATCAFEHDLKTRSLQHITLSTTVDVELSDPVRFRFSIEGPDLRVFYEPGSCKWRMGTKLNLSFFELADTGYPVIAILKEWTEFEATNTIDVLLEMSSEASFYFKKVVRNEFELSRHRPVTIGPPICHVDSRIKNIINGFDDLLSENKSALTKFIAGRKSEVDLRHKVQCDPRIFENFPFLLDSDQEKVLVSFSKGEPCILVEGAPGTGKTITCSSVIELNRRKSKRSVLIAATNSSVDNVIERYPESNDSTELRISRLYSSSARHKMSDYLRQFSLLDQAVAAADDSANASDSLADAVLRYETAKRDFLSDDTSTPRSRAMKLVTLKDMERTLQQEYLKEFSPDLFALTTEMALRGPIPSIDTLILDDASQLSVSNFLALLCSWKGIKHVVAIGDSGQLKPYSAPYAPEWFSSSAFNRGVHGLWRHSDSFLKQHAAVFPMKSTSQTSAYLLEHWQDLIPGKIELMRCYRYHRDIFDTLILPSYPRTICAAPSMFEAQRLRLPCASDGSPVLFVHIDAPEKKNERLVDEVTTNPAEIETAITILDLMFACGVQAEDVGVLFHHCAQMDLFLWRVDFLQKPYRSVLPVSLVDSIQGREFKFTVVLTTKTMQAKQNLKALQFVCDPHREIVAVSRAREGVYILGDWSALGLAEFWTARLNKSISSGGLVSSVLAPIPRQQHEVWTACRKNGVV